MLTAGIWAFSSVGRASPLQGEGQKFESSNAHHKKDSNNKLLSFLLCLFLLFFCLYAIVQEADKRQNQDYCDSKVSKGFDITP